MAAIQLSQRSFQLAGVEVETLVRQVPLAVQAVAVRQNQVLLRQAVEQQTRVTQAAQAWFSVILAQVAAVVQMRQAAAVQRQRAAMAVQGSPQQFLGLP
jgi:hypothetical protein